MMRADEYCMRAWLLQAGVMLPMLSMGFRFALAMAEAIGDAVPPRAPTRPKGNVVDLAGYRRRLGTTPRNRSRANVPSRRISQDGASDAG